MVHKNLILSSTSKPRQALLARLQIPFEVMDPNIDETPHRDEIPHALVSRLALLKANASAKRFPQHFIIGADQVGVLNEEIFGKPMTYENTVQQLQILSGQTLRFYTGICLLDAETDTHQSAVEVFEVTYRKLSLKMIENYLEKETPYHCAGSCQAEGLGIALIRRFQGNDYTALFGLPLIRLVNMLENVGLSPLDS